MKQGKPRVMPKVTPAKPQKVAQKPYKPAQGGVRG